MYQKKLNVTKDFIKIYTELKSLHSIFFVKQYLSFNTNKFYTNRYLFEIAGRSIGFTSLAFNNTNRL